MEPASSPHKKHKKHKHKKHKRRKEDDFSGPDTGSEKPYLKLKIKIGGKTLGEKSLSKGKQQSLGETSQNDQIDVVNLQPKAPEVNSDISDEDEWLEALESGKLDDNELRRIKDPALMTARQRALFESKSGRDGPVQAYHMLPMGYKQKEMTEEMILKRALKAKKRRQQAKEKTENDKKQTIDRLLKKQDSKLKTSKARALKKVEVPKVSYINSQDRICISLPSGIEFPLKKQLPKEPPKVVKCGMPGCQMFKKYSCSKTGTPLCSFECYKKNLQLFSCAASITCK